MRELASAERIRTFMRRLGNAADRPTCIYLTGGGTAVLLGWRSSTIDVDLKIQPESDAIFRAIPLLKEELNLNVELASPPDFIPELPDWESRNLYIGREGSIDWFHFDPYSQALAKIERAHAQDLEDVDQMLRNGLVIADKLREMFRAIEPRLIRYPAIDPAAFARRVEAVCARFRS